ncbi:MAG: hypothetical protein PHW11_10035 [Anaerolineaceae bacterium]|jgi:curli biogenesis system outer membrane secretion channel CsgG|nr:hypothetical protein [Anaerolineaceae bacterium]MDD4042536.1 hypothetical protein [Anaerolineaceae bacterium]MDD4577689.1 hypothetical protein [Anaerolineaceae bacterium]
MKTKKNLMLIVGLLAILVLSACSTQATETVETPIAVDATLDLSTLSDTEMEAFILEKTQGNHTLEFILEKDFTREEWSETIDRMIGYGAEINAYEKEAIIEWLLNR